MNQRSKNGLKLAAAAIFAALLVAITVNAAVDFWTPQAELKESSVSPVSPVEPAALQMPPATQPLPAAPLPEQSAVVPAQQPWNQPLFEPKFDGPGASRSSGGAQTFTAPDFSSALNQFAPLSQVLPPSVSVQGPDPTGISIRPIFSGKSGGVDSGLGAAGGIISGAGSTVGGATSGATSGASSLLKR